MILVIALNKNDAKSGVDSSFIEHQVMPVKLGHGWVMEM